MFKIIDGSAIAQNIQNTLKQDIAKLGSKVRKPYLAVILVGDNAASKIYVQHKEKACKDVGIETTTILKTAQTTEEEILKLIDSLNNDSKVDGILVQMPLPAHINSFNVLSRIRMEKDIDGLSPMNQGLLVTNRAVHIPCTPSGIIKLLESINFKFEGCLAAVVGRSILVGSPIAKLLTHRNATVIHMHSKTRNAWELTQQADLLIAAVGAPRLFGEKYVKEGAVVIDVGIHRINGKLCGDVDFESVKEKTSYITPVPKGVGPMTIACLLLNCFNAYSHSTQK